MNPRDPNVMLVGTGNGLLNGEKDKPSSTISTAVFGS
jgi:hypothetical protein